MSKITFTKSESSGWRLRETNCEANLISVYRTSGIKTARALSGLDYGTGEAILRCKGKMTTRPEGASQKVPKLVIVADEVIVAKLPERNLSKDKLSEGLQQNGSLCKTT